MIDLIRTCGIIKTFKKLSVFFSLFFPPPPFRLIVQDFQVYFFPHTVSFRIPLFCTGTTSRKHIKCAFDIGWLSSSSNKAKQQRKKKKQNGSEKPAQLCWSQWIAFETANATPKKMEVKYRTLKWDEKQTKQNKPKKHTQKTHTSECEIPVRYSDLVAFSLSKIFESNIRQLLAYTIS